MVCATQLMNGYLFHRFVPLLNLNIMNLTQLIEKFQGSSGHVVWTCNHYASKHELSYCKPLNNSCGASQFPSKCYAHSFLRTTILTHLPTANSSQKISFIMSTDDVLLDVTTPLITRKKNCIQTRENQTEGNLRHEHNEIDICGGRVFPNMKSKYCTLRN